MIRAFILLALSFFLASCYLDSTELTSEGEIAGGVRVHSYPIDLLPLYEDQGLDVSAIGKELYGNLFKPAGTGPFSAVVIIHGCGGVLSNSTNWGRWFQKNNVAALVVDSFRTRGISEICTNFNRLNPAARKNDAYSGAKFLSELPFIDKKKIGVMGFSNGGLTTLVSVEDHVKERLSDTFPSFAFAIALYPECGASGLSRRGPYYSPLLILIGGVDDWTLSDRCAELVERNKGLGAPITLQIYPDAHHGFDNPSAPGYLPHVLNYNNPNRYGANVIYNHAAHDSAEVDIQTFLKSLGFL